jgi:4-amino-4-deoxy-L-arabinose transferase-like glycosyltransferase
VTSARWPLAAILVTGFALRLAAVLSFKGAIDPEGSEYARIAENLMSGHGYTGIATPGTQLLFPPLFPFAIAATSLVTGQAELAGRLVSLVMGTLLVVAVYLIALHLYDRSTAYVAALLVAVHPYLVGFSSTLNCEITYLTLALLGVYWSFRSLRESRTRAFVLAGAFFGLAYLTRPEAALYALVVLGVTLTYVFLTDRRAFRRVALRAIGLPVAFAVLAVPYVLWLHVQTGQWRLEGKTPNNYAAAFRIATGATLEEATFGVEPDLTERGARIVSNLSAIQTTAFDAHDLLTYLRARTKVVVKYLLTVPTLTGFGAPALVFLALYGLFSRPWRREVAAEQLILLAILGITSAALLFAYFMTDRFLLMFVPVLIVWAARGIGELARWTASTLRLLRGGAASFARIRLALVLILAATIPLLALPGAYHMHRANRDSQPVRTAGEWLRAHAPGPKMVMDTVTMLAFHATATFVPFPYSDSDVALRYLEKREVNFVVLSDHSRDQSPRPYLEAWMERGVPSPRAKLIYSVDENGGGRIRIYELGPVGRPAR